MTEVIQGSGFSDLFINNTPLLDLRAPLEFEKGAFPCASNIPLLDNQQRHDIGTCYAQQGQQAAINLGHQLINGAVREALISQWRQWHQQNPKGALYCFRGGLRSQTVQQWLHDAGIDMPLIKGGYKALRRFLLENFDRLINQQPLVILSGRTGTAKTRVIESISNSIDLEGLAHHRGSAFGRRPGGQPSQINFENTLSIELLKFYHRQNSGPLILEDESRLIGRCALPLSLQDKMKTAPRVMIEESLESRVQVTLEDYVLAPEKEYQSLYGAEDGFRLLSEALLNGLYRIRRRLGGDRYHSLKSELEFALHEHQRAQLTDAHQSWIRTLLADYYDPMYDYMLSKREGKPLFSGSRQAVRAWLEQNP